MGLTSNLLALSVPGDGVESRRLMAHAIADQG
jgi:hypothetical protein